MNRFLGVFLLSLILTNCNSVKVNQQFQKINKFQTTELGAIIIESHQKSFSPKVTPVSKPEYQTPIPLSIKKVEASGSSYEKLKVLSGKFKEKDTINTTFEKIGYTAVTIQFKDKVKVIENLKDSKNNLDLEYIENKSSTKLVSSVSALIQSPVYKKLLDAEAVFLKSVSQNKYSFLIYAKDKEKELLSVNNTIEVLAYNSEYFCWGSNNRRKIVLKDMVYHKCSCEKGTSVKASKIKKDLEYVKF